MDVDTHERAATEDGVWWEQQHTRATFYKGVSCAQHHHHRLTKISCNVNARVHVS